MVRPSPPWTIEVWRAKADCPRVVRPNYPWTSKARKAHRQSIENLLSIYLKSIENLSKIYRKSIEHPSTPHWTSMCMQLYIDTNLKICIYMHTYIHAYIHVYMCEGVWGLMPPSWNPRRTPWTHGQMMADVYTYIVIYICIFIYCRRIFDRFSIDLYTCLTQVRTKLYVNCI